MFWIFDRIASMRGNKNKTRPLLQIILLIKYSVQQQIHFNGNSLGTNAVVVKRVHCMFNTEKLDSTCPGTFLN